MVSEKLGDKTFALVIDGGTLGILFKEQLENPFREICMKCEAVLCCRMSPAQKADVRKFFHLCKK